MSENLEQLKNILEAALLAAGEPLTIAKMLALFPDNAQPTREELLETITELQQLCESRGVELRKIGNAWRYQTKEQLAPWLRRLSETRPPRYSRALLETLAIVAYRQPVTRGDIEEIRGVSVSPDIIRTLLNRDWIKQVGQRDVPGHPGLFGTTKEFLGYFNLDSLSELPPLPEKRDTMEIAEELNIRLPFKIPPADERANANPVLESQELFGTDQQVVAGEEDDLNDEQLPIIESGSDDDAVPETLEEISVEAESQDTEADLATSPLTQQEG